jgi:ATP-binding cassette subfamily B protein
VLGLLGLAPVFVSGRSAPAALAIGLGGTLLAYRALQKLAVGLLHLTGAAIAWQQMVPLVTAATRAEADGAPGATLAVAPHTSNGTDAPPLVEAHDVVFRYRERGAPVLQGCSLSIHTGDRLLLAGPSGGGKSTLAALLTSLRPPEAGLLLCRGVDLQTLGADGWRQHIVAAPQFHDNYVLTGTFAFNLLLGCNWPPRPADVQEAEAVCRELGLGDLLDRMPAGLWQMVGETGWQLSHGERSRLYIARALLQRADMVILDESFAALDPETLQRAMHCVLARATTVLVIAHP